MFLITQIIVFENYYLFFYKKKFIKNYQIFFNKYFLKVNNVIFEFNFVKVILDSIKKTFYCHINYFYNMHLFLVLGFFTFFIAFMKIGSNDFDIKSGTIDPKF